MIRNYKCRFIFFKEISEGENYGYESQGKPWTQIPPQSSGVLYPPLSAGLFD
jgi:hypothetical protein